MQEEPEKQPFLPRIRMIWFFVIVSLVAIALGIIQAAEQGRALAAGLVFCGLFLALFFAFSGILFLIAFALGATENAIVKTEQVPQSPFIDGSMPDQILPPRNVSE